MSKGAQQSLTGSLEKERGERSSRLLAAINASLNLLFNRVLSQVGSVILDSFAP